MNLKERELLELFLKKEFRLLGAEQEAKWVLEELSVLDNCAAHEKAEEIILRRKNNEPLAYILGHWEFRNLKLKVGPGVLIPRPETEEIVDHALNFFKKNKKQKLKIADLGAGTGAIGLSLATEWKETPSEFFAVEKSPEAVFWLKENFKFYGESIPAKHSFQIVEKSWETFQETDFDLIVSNPPYLSEEEYQRIDAGVRDFEPRMALVPEFVQDPMSAYKSLWAFSSQKLAPGGMLLAEFGPAQVGRWHEIFSDVNYEIYKDLSGKERFISVSL